MNVLHANWLPDCAVISFWIEKLNEDPKGNPSYYDTQHLSNPHPFAMSAKKLVQILPDELDPFTDSHILRLPTRNNLPVSSDQTISRNEVLTPWEVPSAEVLAESFFEFIFTHDLDLLSAEGLTLSTDLKFWRELASFGRLLYEHRHYAPGVVQLEGKHYAAWKATFCSEGEELWGHFLDAIPTICCNILDQDPMDLMEERLLLSFLDACVDSLSRHQHLRHSPGQIMPKVATPLHRQWLSALQFGRFQNLSVKVGSAQEFVNDVKNWTRTLRPRSFDKPWRLTFELKAPETAFGEWQLNFVLSNIREPDQRVNAEQLWSEEAVLKYIPGIQEILFGSLGLAMGVYPELKKSLQTATPSCLRLSPDDAAEFMLEISPKLRRIGFPVDLPDCWDEEIEGLGMRVKITPDAMSSPDRSFFLGINDLIDYKWELTLGDNTLSEEEFRELAQGKQQLVFRKGRWFRIDHEVLEKTIQFIDAEGQEGRGSITDILKLSSKVEKSGGLPVLDVDMAEDPTMFSPDPLPGARFALLSTPDGFHGTLPPYQTQGFSWMVFMQELKLGACLADDMGLGKTIQMIAVLLHERKDGGTPQTSLIVCPMSVVGNWVHELERFSPSLRVMVHHGTDRLGADDFIEAAGEHDVVISTYNLVLRDRQTFKKVSWENIILDEAQNIKNPAAKQSKAIRSLQGKHRFCLTGTPIENRLTELWSIMDFLNSGFLGTIGNFRSSFSQPIERDNSSSRAVILQRLIKPFILRRLKSDKEIIRDLPEKKEMKVYCNLSTEQAALYQGVVDQMIERIDNTQGIERKGLVLSTLTKLKQISNHPTHFLRDGSSFSTARSGKLQRLEEMLDVILESGDRALIFSQFTEVGELLRSKLENKFGVEVLYLHGGSTKKQRDEMVQRFQRPNGPPLFLLSLKAGGVGLNLTAANHVFHFDRWWNPAIENQATDRTYRIGQLKNVQVHKFICVGTVEEKIDKMIEEKKQLAENIVTAGENYLTELSTEELMEVFSLSRDTIIE